MFQIFSNMVFAHGYCMDRLQYQRMTLLSLMDLVTRKILKKDVNRYRFFLRSISQNNLSSFIFYVLVTLYDIWLLFQLRSTIELSTSDYDKEKIQERLAKLSGGVAVLKV